NQFFQLIDYDKKTIQEDSVFGAKNEEDALIIQLENAIADENYILASKINKYMKLINIDYIPLN
ncbi:MAG: hypothetical protein ACC656_07430, partial [Candidatus Heimdallarchaeota archaeon]